MKPKVYFNTFSFSDDYTIYKDLKIVSQTLI